MRDVTQQKRAQADLLKKTNELQAIFRALPDLYFRVDGEGTILDYQAGKSSDLYTAPENFLQKKFVDVLPDGVGEKFSDAIADVASNGDLKTIEYDLTIGSELAHFEARIMPLADGQFIVVVRNVTETRQTTSALRESEQRFWTLADTVPVMIWMTGVDKRFIFVNRGWSEFSGYSLEQARGQAWPIDVHPDDLKRTIATFKTACDARIDFSVQCRMKRKDGGYRWVIQNGRPRFTSSGRFVGYIGTCTDVSSQMTEDGDIE